MKFHKRSEERSGRRGLAEARAEQGCTLAGG
jgi:hypothetical protein